jgi:uncharacterized damage-inducible protein DinB
MAAAAVNLTRVYDTLAQAREKLFAWIRPLSQAQYTQKFPIGLGTLRATLVEIARVEWMYGRRLRGESIPPLPEWPISEERQSTFAELETVWKDEVKRTRATLDGIADWNAASERRVARPGQSTLVRTATNADVALQMLMHEVHHRAQAMAMLRQMGVEAQNLDYISFASATREEPA